MRGALTLLCLQKRMTLQVVELIKDLYNSCEMTPENEKEMDSIYIFLNYWIEHSFLDVLEHKPSFLELFKVIEEKNYQHAQFLNAKLRSISIIEGNQAINSSTLSFGHSPKMREDEGRGRVPVFCIKWDSFNEQDFAVAITRQESILFHNITPLQLLLWNSKEKSSCTAVSDAVSFTNMLADWISCEIVRRVKMEERVILLEKIIHLGESLLSLKNFSSCMSVIGALGSTAVFRLKKTWEKLNPDNMSSFQRMKDILSHRSSYATYRAFLQGSTPPCLPYLGVCLSDLTFIEDGNKDQSEEIFNIKKWQMISTVVDDFMEAQRPSFACLYPPQGDVLEALNSYDYLTETQKHNYSLMVEPKDSEVATQKMLDQFEEAQQKIILLQTKIGKMEQEQEEREEREKEKEEKEEKEEEEEKEKEKEKEKEEIKEEV